MLNLTMVCNIKVSSFDLKLKDEAFVGPVNGILVIDTFFCPNLPRGFCCIFIVAWAGTHRPISLLALFMQKLKSTCVTVGTFSFKMKSSFFL